MSDEERAAKAKTKRLHAEVQRLHEEIKKLRAELKYAAIAIKARDGQLALTVAHVRKVEGVVARVREVAA